MLLLLEGMPDYVFATYILPASPRESKDSKGSLAILRFAEASGYLYTSFEDGDAKENVKLHKLHCLGKSGQMYTLSEDLTNYTLQIVAPDYQFYHQYDPPPHMEKVAHQFVISQLERDPKEVMADPNIPTPEVVLARERVIEALIKSAEREEKVWIGKK